jgi:putative colanic acid biosynthesis acetyltransferase WcaF
MADVTEPKPPQADMGSRLTTKAQASAYVSPWSFGTRLRMLAWMIACAVLFRPTPKHLYRWRNLLLRVFGTRITGTPFVASSAIIKMPWHLTLGHRASLGNGCEVYNLAPIHIGARATVAQQAYLCAGSHDLSDPVLPLTVGEIHVGEDVFIGVRALVLPAVRLGRGAVVGAGAVVTRDVADWTIVAGNPARPIKERKMITDPALHPQNR